MSQFDALLNKLTSDPGFAATLVADPEGALSAHGIEPTDEMVSAIRGLEQVVVLPINERYEPRHVDHVCEAIRAAVGALQHA